MKKVKYIRYGKNPAKSYLIKANELIKDPIMNNDMSNIKSFEDHLAVPGGKVWYQRLFTQASQDKTPMIILHGGPGVPHNYLNNLSQLATNNPVVLYDQLGCGKSTIKNEKKELWVLPRFVEELELLVNHLGFPTVYLFGHSWGGTLAIEYTLKNPNKVKKLILASPLISTPLWVKDTRYLLEQLPSEVLIKVIKHEKEGTIDSKEYQEATHIFYQNYLCRLKEWPDDFKYSFSHLNLSVYQTMFGPSEFTITGNLINFDRVNELHLLKMPTLITCGRFDEARPETMQEMVKLLPNAKLVIFEKSAHIAHLEEPENYLKVLSEFIAEN